MRNTPAYRFARGLGWFSLALGAAEILAPRAVERVSGVREHHALIRGFGVREVVTGLGVLTQNNPVPWLWARLAGDALDLIALLFPLQRNRRRSGAIAAFVSVAGIAVLDYLTARSLSAKIRYRNLPRHDYSSRTGFPEPLEKMRGVATVKPVERSRAAAGGDNSRQSPHISGHR